MEYEKSDRIDKNGKLLKMVNIRVSGDSLQIVTSSEILYRTRRFFSVDGGSFLSRNVGFDTRKYAITPSGSFFPGLLEEITEYFQQTKTKYNINNDAEKLFSEKIQYDGNIESIIKFEYRDYQEETIRKFLEKGRGVAVLPTSAGKTAVMGGLCKTFLKHNKGKILIAVPNKLLLNQTYNDFISFGINDVTKYSGEDKDTDWTKSIVIVTFSKIVQRKKTKDPNKKGKFKDIKEFMDYDLVIVDEVHQLNNRQNNILKFISKVKTSHKFGLTGTLPDDPFGRWVIIGRIGPVVYEKSSIELRTIRHITDVRIKVLKFLHNYIPPQVQIGDPATFLYNAEKEYLMKCEKRNKTLLKLCQKSNNNILILVDRIEQGQIVERLLKDGLKNKKVYFAFGDTSSVERDVIKKEMENRDDVICVAITKLFSTGVSINNLPWVVMMGIGKSKIQLLQTIGRALRLHENKDIATIFDFSDDTYYSETHLLKRLEYYDREQIEYKIKEIRC